MVDNKYTPFHGRKPIFLVEKYFYPTIKVENQYLGGLSGWFRTAFSAPRANPNLLSACTDCSPDDPPLIARCWTANPGSLASGLGGLHTQPTKPRRSQLSDEAGPGPGKTRSGRLGLSAGALCLGEFRSLATGKEVVKESGGFGSAGTDGNIQSRSTSMESRSRKCIRSKA